MNIPQTALHRRLQWEWIIAGAVSVVSSALFYRRVLFSDRVYVAIDVVNLHVPFRTFISHAVKEHQFPLWVPNLWTGAPFLANGDAALLYPMQFFFFLAGPAHGYAWEMWLHSALSVLTMFAFCRLSLGMRVNPALVGGLVFAFGGYALAHTGSLSAVYLGPWVPLIFLAVERAVRGSLIWGWLAPVAGALCWLAGMPEQLYFSLLWLPFFVLALSGTSRGWRPMLRGAIVALSAPLGGALLAAAQVIPQAELVGLTARGGSGLTFDEANFGGLPAVTPWKLLLSDYGHWVIGENAGWIGAVALLLIIFAIIRILWRPDWAPLVLFFLAMAAGSYVLAMGAATPVYHLLYDVLPGMHQFRFPVRWLYPMSLASAVLTAYGAQAVSDVLPHRSKRWIVGLLPMAGLLVFAAAVAFSTPGRSLLLAWAERRDLEIASLVALLVAASGLIAARLRLAAPAIGLASLTLAITFELFASAQFLDWNSPSPGAFYSSVRPIAAYVQSKATGRVLPAAPGTWGEGPNKLGADTALLVDASAATGYSAGWPTERIAPIGRLITDPLTDDRAGSAAHVELWRLLDLQYVVGTRNQAQLANSTALHEVMSDGAYVLYELKQPGARLWTYCGANFLAGPQAVLAEVLAPGFDSTQLYIEGHGRPAQPSSRCGSATLSAASLNDLSATVDLPADGWLLLADAWYPGWHASVDGRSVEVRHGDYFFRAVAVPAGHHQVAFQYRPASLYLGLGLSATASVVWAASLLAVIRFRRRR